MVGAAAVVDGGAGAVGAGSMGRRVTAAASADAEAGGTAGAGCGSRGGVQAASATTKSHAAARAAGRTGLIRLGTLSASAAGDAFAREAADRAPDLDVRVLRPGESTEIDPKH